MEETVGSVCVPLCANSATHTSTCGQDNFTGKMVWRKAAGGGKNVCKVRIRWEEKEKDCVGRVGGWGAREAVKDRTGGGRERRKMHKQMLALGIDAISSVSQLMTNSMEKRKEQKENRNGVSKSKRKTEGLGEEELKGEQETDREKRDGCIHD